MESQEKCNYWLDIAKYDLETAQAMLDSKRWLYVVFMCQQAIEKLVKGLYTLYVDDEVPRVHNIKALLERFTDSLETPIPEAIMKFAGELSAYYLNNRYPDFMAKLSTQIKETEARQVLAQAEEVFEWLLKLKP
jgi:HEPN domain-containing protein